MKSSQLASAFVVSSLCLLPSAFPLLPRSPFAVPQKRSPQSYSVVPVDGGSTANNGPAVTQTITNSIVQTSLSTILSTILVTESDTPNTRTVTATSVATIVTTVAEPITITPSTMTVSLPAEASTVTVNPSITSSAYDNGLWHTTYYTSWTATPETAVVQAASTQSTTAVTSSSLITSAPLQPTVTNWATYYGTW